MRRLFGPPQGIAGERDAAAAGAVPESPRARGRSPSRCRRPASASRPGGAGRSGSPPFSGGSSARRGPGPRRSPGSPRGPGRPRSCGGAAAPPPARARRGPARSAPAPPPPSGIDVDRDVGGDGPVPQRGAVGQQHRRPGPSAASGPSGAAFAGRGTIPPPWSGPTRIAPASRRSASARASPAPRVRPLIRTTRGREAGRGAGLAGGERHRPAAAPGGPWTVKRTVPAGTKNEAARARSRIVVGSRRVPQVQDRRPPRRTPPSRARAGGQRGAVPRRLNPAARQ